MAGPEITDRRIQDRAVRKGELRSEQVAKESLERNDFADNLERPDAEEIERLRETLATEKKLRDERIEIARKRRPEVTVPVHAAMPLDDEL